MYHTPVLIRETVEGLSAAPGKRFIDATYGGGGHTKALQREGAQVLGIDQDPDAGAITGNFRDIEAIGKREGFTDVDGVLFDLGVSSHQLDTPERGFSFRFADAPLDLRMNQRIGEPAAKLIQRCTQGELYEILAGYGEAEKAEKLAREIKKARPQTTGELLTLVGKGTAAQVFQALRIAVNDELGALNEGLEGAKHLIKPGGRLAVISFHSLEDRIVKQFMKSGGWRVLTKKPIVPTREEQDTNSRSRSAKLRIAERL